MLLYPFDRSWQGRGMKLYFDGGCRPNPGRMELAVVARGTLWWEALGDGNSELAEWLALLRALALAKDAGARSVELRGDSLSVINQATGRAPCRLPALGRCRSAFLEASADFANLRLRHVKRSQNLAGIALASRWER